MKGALNQMSGKRSEPTTYGNLLSKPEVGTGLTILSGLFFLFLCMILPLVGKSGVKTEHAGGNFAAFLLPPVMVYAEG